MSLFFGYVLYLGTAVFSAFYTQLLGVHIIHRCIIYTQLAVFDINVLFQHEDLSVKMFDHLVSSNNLLGEFEKYGLTEQDRTFIKEQIAGPRKHIQKV